MDLIESIDGVFTNLQNDILSANGDISLIQKHIKNTQQIILCYTTIASNANIDYIKPRSITKECIIV